MVYVFHCTLSATQSSEVENLEFSETSENISPRFFHSEFSVLHYNQNQKLRDENLRVFSEAF